MPQNKTKDHNPKAHNNGAKKYFESMKFILIITKTLKINLSRETNQLGQQ